MSERHRATSVVASVVFPVDHRSSVVNRFEDVRDVLRRGYIHSPDDPAVVIAQVDSHDENTVGIDRRRYVNRHERIGPGYRLCRECT